MNSASPVACGVRSVAGPQPPQRSVEAAVRQAGLQLLRVDGASRDLVPGPCSHVAHHHILDGLAAQCRRPAGRRARRRPELPEEPNGLGPEHPQEGLVREGHKLHDPPAQQRLQALAEQEDGGL